MYNVINIYRYIYNENTYSIDIYLPTRVYVFVCVQMDSERST